jgi:hypothetical protein
MDIRCALIRQVAERLYIEDSVKAVRMCVKVTAVIYEESNRVFCQVGDSSGLMLAYLKKDRLSSIKEGDVVRLLSVTGVRGK